MKKTMGQYWLERAAARKPKKRRERVEVPRFIQANGVGYVPMMQAEGLLKALRAIEEQGDETAKKLARNALSMYLRGEFMFVEVVK